jgi:hypothetical protein
MMVIGVSLLSAAGIGALLDQRVPDHAAFAVTLVIAVMGLAMAAVIG